MYKEALALKKKKGNTTGGNLFTIFSPTRARIKSCKFMKCSSNERRAKTDVSLTREREGGERRGSVCEREREKGKEGKKGRGRESEGRRWNYFHGLIEILSCRQFPPKVGGGGLDWGGLKWLQNLEMILAFLFLFCN